MGLAFKPTLPCSFKLNLDREGIRLAPLNQRLTMALHRNLYFPEQEQAKIVGFDP